MSNWTIDRLRKIIHDSGAEELFDDLYGQEQADTWGLDRIQNLLAKAQSEVTHLFSAPGRTELGGNHTDHNLGKVLCAAVQNDTLAAVVPRLDSMIVLISDGFPDPFVVDCNDTSPRDSERETTESIIRGVVAGIVNFGGRIGGFEAWITSNVGIGSGLSSSASFEVLIGTIINDLYNDGQIPPTEIAKIGQYAENTYFGKPCGLMDQTASAIGGVLKLDFADPHEIKVTQVGFNWNQTDYVLAVVNTGSNHTDLTQAYASMPEEMNAVAHHLGATYLREINQSDFWNQLPAVRLNTGDRATLRAMHFFYENNRVDQMLAALDANDFATYLEIVIASGLSSQNILQNVVPPGDDGRYQSSALALGLSQLFIEDKRRGVARVHGGGFAGAIQVYIYKDDFEEYKIHMDRIFGADVVQNLIIREQGACMILKLA